VKAIGGWPLAFVTPTFVQGSWQGADRYQIAKNRRANVERADKYYAAHVTTNFYAVAINIIKLKTKKNS